MALIWRGIFEVDDASLVASAVPRIEEWLRWKLHDDGVTLPGDGARIEHPSGCEITARTVRDGAHGVLRATLFEGRADEELRTTVTILGDGAAAWAWIDLERWSADAFLESWVPIAPGVVGTLLRTAACRRGPSRLAPDAELATGDEGAALARRIVDADRELPLVVVSSTREERETDIEPARQRAAQVQRRLMGIAPVAVLGPGAVTTFRAAIEAELGDGFDVHEGAIRTYLPGISSTDSPRRHRFVPCRHIRSRPIEVSAETVAAPIQRGACAQPPPALWRERLRALFEPGREPDDEIQAELERLEGERDQERERRARIEDTLESERETAAATERENDDLRRRVSWLERQLQDLGSPAEAQPDDADRFDPDFCGEVPPEVGARLARVVFPESQWGDADELDLHVSAAWAKRAWRAFRAMDAYAAAKAEGRFASDFRDYCGKGQPEAIPITWIALRESETTDSNERYRARRTFPVDPMAAANEDRVYMPAHIKIEQGGSPSPRIHFHDDTAGPTGRIHVGYFGDHLDNRSTS